MPDNLSVTEGSGRTVAADDVGGVLYQRIKVGLGADGAATDWTGATTDGGPSWTSVYKHTVSADATGTVELTDAPTAGQKIVVDDIIFSTDTAMSFTFDEETSGTDMLKVFVPANGVLQITPRGKWKLATADKKLIGDASVAGNIAVTVFFHSEA